LYSEQSESQSESQSEQPEETTKVNRKHSQQQIIFNPEQIEYLYRAINITRSNRRISLSSDYPERYRTTQENYSEREY
jgi:hypothetical protein